MNLYKLLAVDFEIHGTREDGFNIDFSFKYNDISKKYTYCWRPLVEKSEISQVDIYEPLMHFVLNFIDLAKIDCEQNDVSEFYSKIYDDFIAKLNNYVSDI